MTGQRLVEPGDGRGGVLEGAGKRGLGDGRAAGVDWQVQQGDLRDGLRGGGVIPALEEESKTCALYYVNPAIRFNRPINRFSPLPFPGCMPDNVQIGRASCRERV